MGNSSPRMINNIIIILFYSVGNWITTLRSLDYKILKEVI
jgi:hypothetical protein